MYVIALLNLRHDLFDSLSYRLLNTMLLVYIFMWKCTFYIKTFRYCELNNFYSVVVGLIM